MWGSGAVATLDAWSSRNPRSQIPDVRARPLNAEQTARAPRARSGRIALACALMAAGLLAHAAPAAAGPLNVGEPDLSRTGRTLVTGNGNWLPSTNTYSYLWQRCNAGGCFTVPGRTASTYLLTTADIGQTIRSIVIARNQVLGASDAASPTTSPIASAPPVNVVPPGLTGSGSTLTSTLGAWSDPTPGAVAYARRWQRCGGGDGLNCQEVPGRTGATYSLTEADADKFIRVVVFAEGLGARSVASAPLGPIMPLPAPGGGGSGGGGGAGNTGTTPPSPTTVRKMRPFPKVVVTGRLARGLTFISGLVIRRGPRGASVSVRCRGRGCPRGGGFRGKLNRRGELRLKRYQRIYGPGATVEIRVTKRGTIGKFTRLRVRARSVPSRRDACLKPGATNFSRCP